MLVKHIHNYYQCSNNTKETATHRVHTDCSQSRKTSRCK